MDLARSLIARGPFTPLNHREANKAWANFRQVNGAAHTKPRLLTDPDHNAKFAKTAASVYGLALAQAETSLVANVCRFSTSECRAGCVSFAGRGSYSTVQNGRIRRTLFLNENPEAFLGLLTYEVGRVLTKHGEDGRVRLNTFSDLPWEVIHPDLFSRWSKLKFYDYTKWPARAVPPNYRLIYSASEKTTDQEIEAILGYGGNVAVVFDIRRKDPLPAKYLGFPVIDGDKSDDRYIDPHGIVVGLRSKGRMRRQNGTMPRKVT